MKTTILLFMCAVLFACTPTNTNEKEPKMENTNDYVLTCNLKNDPELIAQYKHLHNEGMWPEVKKTFEASGAKSVRIYIQDTRLVLIISLPESVSMDDFQEKYNTTAPDKIKEWDALMASFQQAPPGGEPNGTWVAMELMFEFKK